MTDRYLFRGKKEREQYILCVDCGFAIKLNNAFIKEYKSTGIVLCKKCAEKLANEILGKEGKENEHISKVVAITKRKSREGERE